ncbi:MAG: GNAT family N-acetyltransferase [Candidatus Aminicenantes bacterium]|nr:GNAT family N-acetyltransferase [Candidatus Aminicenantes bacterium]
MRKAEHKDKAIVTTILAASFKNDPHINWFLEESRNRNKFNILIDYVFEETIRKGEIYISKDNMATALWESEKKEKFSLNYILRNLSFLFSIGIKSTIRILKMNKLIYSQFPKHRSYFHLYLIGVLPEVQGKGLASSLMNPILAEKKANKIPVYLETANPKNVEIYKRKGFSIFNTFQTENTTIYFMKT